MKTVIIGHRGVGKSSLLKRWIVYQPEISFYDLDAEIEKSESSTISKIFSEKGEEYFRKMEIDVLQKVLNENVVVALGAGFPVEKIPHGVFILWLRRDTDSSGRIFLDRPRLNKTMTALEEFEFRFKQREGKFSQIADQIYTMPEGIKGPDEQEKQILTQTCELKSLLTLKTKTHYKSCQYEIRDDLMNETKWPDYKPSELLYSVRTSQNIPQQVLDRKIQIDWDLQRELQKNLPISILSTHENNLEASIKVLKPFEASEYQLKLCPTVKNWSELCQGYQWQQENPEKRSFLPRSQDGRWSWFRLFMKGKQKINFVREGEGSATDQPTIWEWISEPATKSVFAAVLGDPIIHSFSPAYHKIFFQKMGMPFYRIKIEQAEWKAAFEFLDKMGLRAAAVTSPLKQDAGKVVGLQPMNTLMKTSDHWKSCNTDEVGAKALLRPYLNRSLLVWGGGGVLEILKKVAPKASFYSVRSGGPREGSSKIKNPDVLVWAAPPGSVENFPSDLVPRTVVDLSYTQNSEALQLAQKLNCQYVSGLKMFEIQAEAQQEFWKDLV